MCMSQLSSCKTVEDCYERLNTISEGVYGVVHRARSKKNGEIVALKKVKTHKSRSGFPIHSLREMKLLQGLKPHSNVIRVREVVISTEEKNRPSFDVYMVMDYAHNDVQHLMQTNGIRWTLTQVKCLMYQLLSGVQHLHDSFILHRDLKTANLLLTDSGVLKICDLGMARRYGTPLKPYTNLVVTLWYRAPELLMGSDIYGPPIDIWSVGCIYAELLTGQVLFQGEGEFKQIELMFECLGTPNDEIWPDYSKLPHAKKFHWKNFPGQLHQRFPINIPLPLYYAHKSKHNISTQSQQQQQQQSQSQSQSQQQRIDNEISQITENFNQIKNEDGNKDKHEYTNTTTTTTAIITNEKENSNNNQISDGPILTSKGFEILQQLLCYDPLKRLNATTALKHEWFTEEPKMAETWEMPKFEEGHVSIQTENRPKVSLTEDASC